MSLEALSVAITVLPFSTDFILIVLRLGWRV